MHRNIDGILNILEFVHTMSADIVWTSINGFTGLRTYIETNSKNFNTYYKNFGLKSECTCVLCDIFYACLFLNAIHRTMYLQCTELTQLI